MAKSVVWGRTAKIGLQQLQAPLARLCQVGCRQLVVPGSPELLLDAAKLRVYVTELPLRGRSFSRLLVALGCAQREGYFYGHDEGLTVPCSVGPRYLPEVRSVLGSHRRRRRHSADAPPQPPVETVSVQGCDSAKIDAISPDSSNGILHRKNVFQASPGGHGSVCVAEV